MSPDPYIPCDGGVPHGHDGLADAARFDAVAVALVHEYKSQERLRRSMLGAGGVSSGRFRSDELRCRVTIDGVTRTGSARQIGPRDYLIADGGDHQVVQADLVNDVPVELTVLGRTVPVSVLTLEQGSPVIRVTLPDHTVDVRVEGTASVTCPFPAVVARESVVVGERVTAGQEILVLEAMKLESPVIAPVDSVVVALPLRVGARAAAGEQVALLDPLPGGSDVTGALSGVAGDHLSAPTILRNFTLGYDVTEAEFLLALADSLVTLPAANRSLLGLLDIYPQIVKTIHSPSASPSVPSLTRLQSPAVPAESHAHPAGPHNEGTHPRVKPRDDSVDPSYRLAVARDRLRRVGQGVAQLLTTIGSTPKRPPFTGPALDALEELGSFPGPSNAVPRHVSDWARVVVHDQRVGHVDPPTVETSIESEFGVGSASLPPAFREWYEQVRAEVRLSRPECTLLRIERACGTAWLALVDAGRVADELTGVSEALALIRRAQVEDDYLSVAPALIWIQNSKTCDPQQLRTVLPALVSGIDVHEVCFVHNDGTRSLGLRVAEQGVVLDREAPFLPTDLEDPYIRRVHKTHQRGLVDPYEIAAWVAGPKGQFTELELGERGSAVQVNRPPGLNEAGVVMGLVRTCANQHPQGVDRVLLAGDPSKALGALAESECSRIIAALDYAQENDLPVEWFALSSGARIALDSGTENMDWIARVLRRCVEFTQDGGEINVVVVGINVGAQSYWNAVATMLMHTRGILVMTSKSGMVLTGKRSLDFAGSVSAADDQGIGGYPDIMGPNGQAQYWAHDLAQARDLLEAHYSLTYRLPHEAGTRSLRSSDPRHRDITVSALRGDVRLQRVADIFSDQLNPDRKAGFDIRDVMTALADEDQVILERWADVEDGSSAVVADARLGGHAVCLVGIQANSMARDTAAPFDGPTLFSGGTLFPNSSKKIARAVNASSGIRPVVVLANLAGFDGSPESMRRLQLEYGAEIGRAITNFKGRIVFCILTRIHGGAFVVFSKALNSGMIILAVRGARASVIGGAPAANVVFASEVARRIDFDERMTAMTADHDQAHGISRLVIAVEREDLRGQLRSEKITEIAREFDATHGIHRAVSVGSVDRVIEPTDLRPSIISALEEPLTAPIRASRSQ